MSCVLCDRCQELIDSDYDPDCFVNGAVAGSDLIACESCRDDLEEAGELDVETNTLTTPKDPV